MTTYKRRLVSVRARTGERSAYNEYYTQPRFDRLKYLAFHHVLEKFLYSLPVKPLTHLYESYDVKRNRDNDDVWFMPFTNRLDCKCFDLDTKNNHKIMRP